MINGKRSALCATAILLSGGLISGAMSPVAWGDEEPQGEPISAEQIEALKQLGFEDVPADVTTEDLKVDAIEEAKQQAEEQEKQEESTAEDGKIIVLDAADTAIQAENAGNSESADATNSENSTSLLNVNEILNAAPATDAAANETDVDETSRTVLAEKPDMSSLKIVDLLGPTWETFIGGQVFFEDAATVYLNDAKSKAIGTWKIKLVNGTNVYTGKQVKPKVRVYYDNGNTLVSSKLYSVSYSNVSKVGAKGKITITASWDKNKKRTCTFTVKKAPIKKVKAAKLNAFKYTGNAIKPKPVLKYNGKKLVEGKDYKLSYSNNKKVGTAKIKVVGQGNFTGTATCSFKIVKK